MESMHTKLKMSEKLMLIDKDYKTSEELIRAAGDAAIALGFAEEGFSEDVVRRELEYPTGLNAVMPIAIPHVSTHCRDSFMAIATLRDAVLFEPMDGLGGAIACHVVFVFGLVDHRDQVKVLQRLAQMFKDKETLQQLRDAKTAEEGLALVADYLGELVEIN